MTKEKMKLFKIHKYSSLLQKEKKKSGGGTDRQTESLGCHFLLIQNTKLVAMLTLTSKSIQICLSNKKNGVIKKHKV